MTNSSDEIASAFFAYPSKPQEIGQTIEQAIKLSNASSPSIQLHGWPANDISGIPITKPIFEKIADCKYLAADITYLNENVVFEIGYAIGQGKRCLLYKNSSLKGETQTATEVGIFDTLGYDEYENSQELLSLLSRRSDFDPFHTADALDTAAPVYLVEPPKRSDAFGVLVSRIKKARWKYRSFNPAEDVRMAAADAIRHTTSSAGVVVILVADHVADARVHNLRSLFVAGIAHGMDVPLLILHDHEYSPPLDVRDISRKFKYPDDIGDLVQDFSLEITEYVQKTDHHSAPDPSLLEKLRLGDPTAENEMTTLGDYYLATDEFQRAARGEVNLVVGRKGTGKTALFLQLRDRKRADKQNVVVDLKPEGYQLIKLKEKVRTLLTQGSQKHLITAFWEYILLLEIAYKVLEKDQKVHLRDHRLTQRYQELKEAYDLDDIRLNQGDFSERLLKISYDLAQTVNTQSVADPDGQLDTRKLTDVLYKHNLPKLIEKLSEYLAYKKDIWLLFDNIDKGWNVEGVDEYDVLVLRSLIDASRKLERDFRKKDLVCHSIIFIRDDVYTLLMGGSSDYGKEMRASLDWSDPTILASVLNNRISNSTDTHPGQLSISNLAVSHVAGEATIDFLVERSLMRPRNLLKLFKYAVGYAINFKHDRIEVGDLERAEEVYSQDLVIEADRELSDVLPRASKLIYEFIEEPVEMSRSKLLEIINRRVGDPEDIPQIIDFLIYFGILGVRNGGTGDVEYIHNVHYNPELIYAKMRRWGEATRFVVNPAFVPALELTSP